MATCTHTILVAEDDPDDQELIASAFAQVDPSMKVCIVDDGRKAVDYLQEAVQGGLPCVILLDYNMPELNGAQVIQRLAQDERFASIPKVVLSTSGNPLFIRECLAKGAHAYLVKPDDFSALLGIARQMVALCNGAA